MKVQIDFKKALEATVTRNTKRLYLSFLFILEDMVKDGILNDSEFQRLRKKVLDNGNGSIRDILEELSGLL